VLLFEVVDDGKGFDQSAHPRGPGLNAMSDQLGAFDGRLTITSEPGGGTRVSGTIPLAR
jgi:signal transduction histidine kinase